MNIIPFILTILLLLTIITYDKLSTFLVHTATEKIAIRHMSDKEITEINKTENEIYDKASGSGSSHSQGKKIAASKTLCLKHLIDNDAKLKEPSKFNTNYTILSRLIFNLYKDQPFMKKMLDNRSDAVDLLIQKVIEKAGSAEYHEKIKKREDLAIIVLDDEEMQHAWATMLNGKEHATHKENGFPSLWNFFNKSLTIAQPIRLYLASKEILLSIFDDEDFVDTVLQKRMEIYNGLRCKKDKKISKEKASLDFKQLVESKLSKNLDSSLFNLEVSSTRPP